MYNIHCQWHTLKKCIVGRTYHPNFFKNINDDIARVCEETEDDIKSLTDILTHFNVTIIRPQIDIDDSFENYENTSVPRPPMAPRDSLVVIGNSVYEFGFDHPSIKNCIEGNTKKSVFAPSRTVKTLPAPSITQLGKDILIDTKCFTNWEINWIEKQLSNYRVNKISIGGHNDGSFIILKPGVAISLDSTIDWQEFFPNWNVLTIEDDRNIYCKEWLIERKINQGKWWIPGQENNNELSKFVNKWLSNWVGFASETVFSLNALIINDSHVVINTHNKEVIQFLKNNNIEAIIAPQRHQHFWDNGIHCMTLDLYREGDSFDLFPNRNSPFICKGF